MKVQVASLLGRSATVRHVVRLAARVGIVAAVSISSAYPATARAGYSPPYSEFVIDANTGKVLHAEAADELRYPASLTKMMTLYLTFEALQQGRLRLGSEIPVSAHAAGQAPTKLGLRAGSRVRVEDCILGIVTKSANDAAEALGEYLGGGSEVRFAQMMTAKARELGMTRTTYRNANGLPNSGQKTTARDQARLGIALHDRFPQYYHFFSVQRFVFGKTVVRGHNRLIGSVPGVDGIKTGFIYASGFNLVTSVHIDGKSLVGVVIGGTTAASRDKRMRQLVATYLPQASSRGARPRLVAHGHTVPAPIPNSERHEEAAVEVPTADIPLPGKRYGRENVDETAYSQNGDGNHATAAISRQILLESPVPKHRHGRHGEHSQNIPANVDRTVTSSTGDDTAGWSIQVGISDERDRAIKLLEQIKHKAGGALRSARMEATPYGEGKKKLYRARFVGFKDEKLAVNTCQTLKKKGVKCWASAH
nr:D-alanyl-D-alanine carboxypeptidase [Allorhizobium sonneratiae]